MKNRGLNDILIACSDNLKGFNEAITTVFPQIEYQLCIVHQTRNSLKFVSYKDKKALAQDLKKIYPAINDQQAADALETFNQIWGSKYPYIAKTWKLNYRLGKFSYFCLIFGVYFINQFVSNVSNIK